MNYVTITSLDINNGLGCRVTLWISGCHHNCEGCQNQWLQDYKKGKPLSECYEDLYNKLGKKYIKGMTLSGGDPLDQEINDLYELKELLLRIQLDFPDKDIWLYSGFRMEELNTVQKEIVDLCHYFVDGEFILSKRDINLAFRGSDNQRIWKNENKEWEVIETPEQYFTNL